MQGHFKMQDKMALLRSLLPHVYEKILLGLEATIVNQIKFQVIGLYTIIFVLTDRERLATTVELAKLGGVTPTTATRLAQELVNLGWVTRKAVPSPHGRGRQYAYYPVFEIDQLQNLLGDITNLPKPFMSASVALPNSFEKVRI